MYGQILHIPVSKESRHWSGSSYESRLIGIYFVYKKNVLKPPHEHITQAPLVYDQILHIPVSKQSRPWSGSSHESRLIWIYFVYKNVSKPQHEHIWSDIYFPHKQDRVDPDKAALARAAWSGSSLFTKMFQSHRTSIYDQIFHIPLSKTEKTLIRQLSRGPPDPDLPCLQKKRFKAAARAYNTRSTCVWSDISYPSRPWSGSPHESRLIWTHLVYKNVFKAALWPVLMYLNPFCANISRCQARVFVYSTVVYSVQKVIQPKDNGNSTSKRASSIQKIK